MAVNSLILDSKKTFYNDRIDSCDGDQKELFKIIDKIMHNYEEPQLPSHNSLDEFVNKFADFFVTKIPEFRKQVINNSTSNTWTDEKICSSELLAEFYPATENEIKKLKNLQVNHVPQTQFQHGSSRNASIILFQL